MDQILHQVGELLLGSVPTIVLFLITVTAYNFLVHRPLHQVLADRRRRTVGALEDARTQLTVVETRTSEYEGRLRNARNEIYLAREHRIQQWQDEKQRMVVEAQDAARLRVRIARLEIEQSVKEAHGHIEASASQLAAQILQAVMPPPSGMESEMESAR
jgi:F-type H+-transporting ATPase subunit b